MKTVTITLEDDLLHWAQDHAAKRNKSVSGLLREILEEERRQDDEAVEETETYEEAMKKLLALEPQPLGKPGEPLPSRESLYER